MPKPDPAGYNCWPLAAATGIHPEAGYVYGGDAPVRPPNITQPARTSWWIVGRDADW